MRKPLQSLFICVITVLSVTGCDFFRVLAGRPTSKDIEVKREKILRSYQEGSPVKPGMTEEKPGMTQEASLPAVTGNPEPAAAEQGEARMDSAVTDHPAGSPVKPGVTGKKAEKKRYYVIMGAFSSKDNAVKYAERIKAYGYEPEFFGFTEGRTAVGIGGTDDPEEVKAFMKELKGQDFCPEGVWILDRKKK